MSCTFSGLKLVVSLFLRQLKERNIAYVFAMCSDLQNYKGLFVDNNITALILVRTYTCINLPFILNNSNLITVQIVLLYSSINVLLVGLEYKVIGTKQVR